MPGNPFVSSGDLWMVMRAPYGGDSNEIFASFRPAYWKAGV